MSSPSAQTSTRAGQTSAANPTPTMTTRGFSSDVDSATTASVSSSTTPVASVTSNDTTPSTSRSNHTSPESITNTTSLKSTVSETSSALAYTTNEQQTSTSGGSSSGTTDTGAARETRSTGAGIPVPLIAGSAAGCLLLLLLLLGFTVYKRRRRWMEQKSRGRPPLPNLEDLNEARRQSSTKSSQDNLAFKEEDEHYTLEPTASQKERQKEAEMAREQQSALYVNYPLEQTTQDIKSESSVVLSSNNNTEEKEDDDYLPMDGTSKRNTIAKCSTLPSTSQGKQKKCLQSTNSYEVSGKRKISTGSNESSSSEDYLQMVGTPTRSLPNESVITPSRNVSEKTSRSTVSNDVRTTPKPTRGAPAHAPSRTNHTSAQKPIHAHSPDNGGPRRTRKTPVAGESRPENTNGISGITNASNLSPSEDRGMNHLSSLQEAEGGDNIIPGHDCTAIYVNYTCKSCGATQSCPLAGGEIKSVAKGPLVNKIGDNSSSKQNASNTITKERKEDKCNAKQPELELKEIIEDEEEDPYHTINDLKLDLITGDAYKVVQKHKDKPQQNNNESEVQHQRKHREINANFTAKDEGDKKKKMRDPVNKQKKLEEDFSRQSVQDSITANSETSPQQSRKYCNSMQQKIVKDTKKVVSHGLHVTMERQQVPEAKLLKSRIPHNVAKPTDTGSSSKALQQQSKVHGRNTQSTRAVSQSGFNSMSSPPSAKDQFSVKNKVPSSGTENILRKEEPVKDPPGQRSQRGTFYQNFPVTSQHDDLCTEDIGSFDEYYQNLRRSQHMTGPQESDQESDLYHSDTDT